MKEFMDYWTAHNGQQDDYHTNDLLAEGLGDGGQT